MHRIFPIVALFAVLGCTQPNKPAPADRSESAMKPNATPESKPSAPAAIPVVSL